MIDFRIDIVLKKRQKESTLIVVCEMNLDNQEIGDIGESRSDELCTLSSYVPNKAHKDRMGWDYHIQDRKFIDESISLDKRSLGHTCYIQIKTKHFSAGPGFKIRLSAAEKLAKSRYPAFIIIYTLDDNTYETLNIRIIHVKDQILNKILQRLRRADSHSEDVNSIDLYFNTINGTLIKQSSNSLRDYIKIECGHNPDLYIANKRMWLEKAGYTELPWDVRVVLDLTDGTDFHEAIVMGTPIRLAADISVIENRYGIGKTIDPYPGALKKGATIYIENEPYSNGRIQFSSPGALPFQLSAKMVRTSLNEDNTKHKVAIRSQIADILFDIQYGDKEANAIFMHGEEKRSSAKMSVSSWIKYFSCLYNMSIHGGRVSYISDGSFTDEVNLKVESSLFHPSSSNDYLRMSRVMRKFAYLMDVTGVEFGEIEYKSITKTAHLCAVAYHRITGQIKTNVGGFENIGDLETINMIVFGYFTLCDKKFAYKIPIFLNKGPAPEGIWHEISSGDPYIKQIDGDLNSQRDFFNLSHDGKEYQYKKHLFISDYDYINTLYDSDL